MDLTTMTDAELDRLRLDVLTEQERRSNLEAIPEQVADLARTFRAGGGDPDALTAAISTTEPTP